MSQVRILYEEIICMGLRRILVKGLLGLIQARSLTIAHMLPLSGCAFQVDAFRGSVAKPEVYGRSQKFEIFLKSRSPMSV